MDLRTAKHVRETKKSEACEKSTLPMEMAPCVSAQSRFTAVCMGNNTVSNDQYYKDKSHVSHTHTDKLRLPTRIPFPV